MAEQSMTQPMRERIARAICRADNLADGYAPSTTLEASINDGMWKNYTAQADAVLAEIETPTEGMIDAGVLVFFDPDVRTAVAKILGAAIRAAREGR